MLLYYFRTQRYAYASWLFMLTITLIWFLADKDMTTIPVVSSETLPYINASYGTDFASVEDATARLPIYMIDRFFGFAYPRFQNSGGWMLLLLSSLLLAQPLGTQRTQLPPVYGHSRIKHVLFLSGMFYLTVIILQGVQLFLHVCNMGIYCMRVMDWKLFMLAYVVQSISLCGFVSITTIFAFATQRLFPTVLLSLAFLVLMVIHLLPVSLVKIDWTQPPSYVSIRHEMLLSLCKVVASTVVSCIIYCHRDIRKG